MENLKLGFKLNFRCAYFCGFLEHPEKSKLKKSLTVFILTTVVFLPCTASLLKFLLDRRLENFIDVAAVLVGLSCLGLKIIGLMWKNEDANRCLEQLYDLDVYDEDEILKITDKKLYTFVFLFTIAEFVIASIYILVALCFGGESCFILPFPIKVDNTYLHVFVIALQIYQGLASSILSGLIETIIVVFFTTFIAHLKCLNMRVKNLAVTDNDQMKKCIEHHVKLLELFDSITDCFKEVIMIQSYAMTIILCTLAYQLSTVSPLDNFALFIKIFGVMCAMSSQIFMPYCLGSIASDESMKIVESVYFSKWYEGDVKFRKDLIVVITMAQKKIEMNIFGFFELNLEKFLKVRFNQA